MFNFKTLITTLLLSGIVVFSSAQAAPAGATTNPAAPDSAGAPGQASAKPKLHKAKQHASKKHKATQHAAKAKTHQAKGKSRSKGPGLEAY